MNSKNLIKYLNNFANISVVKARYKMNFNLFNFNPSKQEAIPQLKYRLIKNSSLR